MIFFASGLQKASHVGGFARSVAEYAVLPNRLAAAAARLVILSELVCGLALLVGFAVPLAAAAAAALVVAFATAVAVNLARGRQFDCGCHGAHNREQISWELVIRMLASTASPYSRQSHHQLFST